MNLKDLLMYSNNYLKENNVNDGMIISKQLIQKVFQIEKEKIIINYEKVLDENLINEYNSLLKKIIDGIPVQYLTNNQEFMKMNFYVDENVLIPQPDTEILVEEIISKYKDKNCKILDLCTGSGAIAISLAKYIEKSEIVATDISIKAIQIAKLNAEKNLVHRKIKFIESDMFENINIKDFDVIVSNPPYIKTDEIALLDKQVQNEPFIALDGGNDGLKFYKIIINNASNFIKNEGELYLEIGFNQKSDLLKLFNKNYYDIYSKRDLSNNDRIVVAKVRRDF